MGRYQCKHFYLLGTDILLLDEQANKYRALDNWFITPQGNRVAHAFAAEIMHVSEQFSGEILLQLGCFVLNASTCSCVSKYIERVVFGCSLK